ncbi:MAG TPA: hypothetical protein VIE43_05380 [Thermoanaerobaculia bacterium]|nr:hypothetical protein [Thermoanaerobaculia bacterium]
MTIPSLRLSAVLLALAAAAAPAFAAAPSWTPLGPFGGSVTNLAVAPSAAATLYATLDGQGAFRSTDGGLSWVPILGGNPVSNVAVDPLRPGTLYLATARGGLQKSTDGGAHWTVLQPVSFGAQAIAVDPVRAMRVYAGTTGSGVLRSTDGGASWQPASVPLPAGAARNVLRLALSRTAGLVYAGTGAGVFKSTDAGLSWQAASHGLPAGAVEALAAAPSDPRTVYASLDSGLHKMVYRSRDGGASWQSTTGPLLPSNSARVLALAVSPRSPTLLWAGTGPNSLFRSADAGAHWVPAGLPPQVFSVETVAVAPSAPNTLYAGVFDQGADPGGVYASLDGGVSWSRRNQGLDGLDAQTVAVPPGSPGVIYAGLDLQGLYRSANSGTRWARVTLPDAPAAGTPLVDFAIAPSSDSTFYALALSWLWRSTDAGAAWTEVSSDGPGDPYLRLLRVDPADPFRLWGAGAIDVSGLPSDPKLPLLRSTDGGVDWATVPTPDLGCEIFDLQFAPSTPATLYVAGGKSVDSVAFCKLTAASLFRSTDDGATWTEADAGLAAPSITALAVDPLDARLVYAGTGGEYVFDNGDGVWKSADGGVSWTRAGDALKGKTITALALSAGTGVLWAANHGAIFRSDDGGATWSDRTAGLQAAEVHKLRVDPADPRRIYAATSGGVWVLEDAAP